MPSRKFIISIIVIALSIQHNFAQNDSIFKKEIYLKIDNFNFNKNNEYFNLIADGYTILGTQLHPKITYKPHPQFQLEFGVFGLYNFGNEAYSKIIPTFSLDYKLWKLDMTVGTLHNENLHQLIAPFDDRSETLLDERRLGKRLSIAISTPINGYSWMLGSIGKLLFKKGMPNTKS
jgi:hypothetical protein